MRDWIADLMQPGLLGSGRSGALPVPVPDAWRDWVASCRRISTPGDYRESVAPGAAQLHLVVEGEWTLASSRDAIRGDDGAMILSGPTDRITHLSSSGGVMIVIELLPIGWLRLVSVPANRAANRFLMLTAIDPIRDAGGPLRQPSRAREETIRRIADALDGDILPTVDQMARTAGVSGRTLHRCCIHAFGFGPMTLLKRQRLLRTLRNMRDVQAGRIADIIPFDYFDQSHFNRDFKAFMGATPSEYRRRDSRSHRLMAAESPQAIAV